MLACVTVVLVVMAESTVYVFGTSSGFKCVIDTEVGGSRGHTESSRWVKAGHSDGCSMKGSTLRLCLVSASSGRSGGQVRGGSSGEVSSRS